MRFRYTFLIGAILALAVTSCAKPDPQPKAEPDPQRGLSPDEKAVAEASNRFAFDLYRQLAGSGKGNVFFSPYSIHTALAMTAHGANGPTRDEMVKVLHLPPEKAKGLAAGSLAKFYSPAGRSYELGVANALWGQKDFGFRPQFLADLAGHYEAGFREVDYVADREAARAAINGWVEDRTRLRIREIVRPDDIDSTTRLVLANAIYFKGEWVTRFDPKHTRSGTFHCADGTKVETPLMYTNNYRCRTGYEKGLRLIELPYRGDDLAMLMIVPDTAQGIAVLEDRLDTGSLQTWVESLQPPREYDLTLPKFEAKTRYSLKEQLLAMGMGAAFGGADFSGIHTSAGLRISKVIHQAFVNVNEDGTEAAAATVVNMGAFDKSVYVDKPFIYLIRDVKNGTILFLGRMMNPRE